MIWKWTLSIADLQTIDVPQGAQFLTVQSQHQGVQIWALCNESNVKERRSIAIYGTGHPIPDNPGKYIGTCQMMSGALVWHVFEAEGTA